MPRTKAADKAVDNAPIEETNSPSNDVVVPKAEYDSLLARLEALEHNTGAGLKPPSVITKRVKERTARLKRIGDMYIVGYTKNARGTPNIRYANDEKGVEQMYLETILTDGKNIEKRELNFIQDIGQNTDVHVVPILKTEAIEHIENYGTVQQKHVPEGGWKFQNTGREVALEVLKYQHISTIKLPNGATIEIDNEFLNI